MFLGIRLIEGVGLDKTLFDGFQDSFSPLFSVLSLVLCDASVIALSLGFMY